MVLKTSRPPAPPTRCPRWLSRRSPPGKGQTRDKGKTPGWQERYTRRLVKETRAWPNVISEICNEPWWDRPGRRAVIKPYLEPAGTQKFRLVTGAKAFLAPAFQGGIALLLKRAGRQCEEWGAGRPVSALFVYKSA